MCPTNGFKDVFSAFKTHTFYPIIQDLWSGVILVVLDGGFNESFSSPQNLGLYDLIQLGHFCNID